ncbi:hypothetical protein KCU86_g16, partial [Aureobasidium melanogenum]
MPSRFLLAYALRKRKQRACRGVKSKVVYTRNRFGVAKRSLKRLGPLEEHLAWRYSGLHSARVTAKGCVKHQVTSYCLFLENIQSNREALAKNNRRMQKFGKEPPEARYAMFCVSSFEKRKRYYWHRDLCANPPASMAIYDCEIFSKVMEYTFRSFRFHRRSCLYSSRARRSARACGSRMKNCIAHSLDGPPTAMRQIESVGLDIVTAAKRHYVTIALRRWSVTVSLSRANLTMKNDDFEAVDFVQAIHISEDCHGLFLAALVIVCAITQTADDIDARTSHRVAPSTRIPDAECGIETQKNFWSWNAWYMDVHVDKLYFVIGSTERRCSFALDRGGNLDRE